MAGRYFAAADAQDGGKKKGKAKVESRLAKSESSPAAAAVPKAVKPEPAKPKAREAAPAKKPVPARKNEPVKVGVASKVAVPKKKVAAPPAKQAPSSGKKMNPKKGSKQDKQDDGSDESSGRDEAPSQQAAPSLMFPAQPAVDGSELSEQDSDDVELTSDSELELEDEFLSGDDDEIDEEDVSGVIYIGHLPSHFQEKQIKKYFGQFGEVVEIKLARSRTTGHSKGHAFVKFRYREVAEVAARTFNGKPMMDRVVRAELLPPEQVHANLFKARTTQRSKFANRRRDQLRRLLGLPASEEDRVEAYSKITKSNQKLQKRLESLGIRYTIPPIRNVPEGVQKA